MSEGYCLMENVHEATTVLLRTSSCDQDKGKCEGQEKIFCTMAASNVSKGGGSSVSTGV